MWLSIGACVYFYLTNLAHYTEGITYIKGIPTPKWTTRMVPLSKWLEDNNWRLAPYGNKEFTKIFRQYRPVILQKYYEDAPANWTDTSLGKYVQSLFFTPTRPATKKLFKKDKIKLGKLKLIKENILKLEERLGITTIPPSTTTEPTTEPYTGPSTRITLTSFFDPDYIFDPNYPLRHIKRLKRNAGVSNRNRIDIENKVSSCNAEPQNIEMLNEGAKSNVVNIFPAGDLTYKQYEAEESKLWIKSKREEYGLDVLNIYNQNILQTKESKIKRYKKDINNLKHENHILVKRELGSIVKRPTRRPHLSRNFKSQSMKRYRMDMRMEQWITSMQSNITIFPGFLRMSQVLADCEKNNLSTLFYVFNGVGYFGSVPPDLLTTTTTTTTTMRITTKGKSATYELGATQVLGANIFGDEMRRNQKVSPGEVDIPNIDLEHQTQKYNESETIKDVKETELIKTTKIKRTRKKKNGDTTESSGNTSKKTRAKRKSTKAVDSLENPLEQDVNSSKIKGKNRKARSLNVNCEQTQQVLEILPTFLCLIYNNMHLRKKRNVNVNEEVIPNANNGEEAKKIEIDEKNKLSHFGRIKESLKRSKNNIFSFVREKKESLVEVPRRARYIAREMYLDGKFFFQELKEVPARMKKDYEEKKDLMKLVWDMLKIFMPVTEKGEKGGTTPETKVVEDPKQYVKNANDYITPDLSDLDHQPTSSKYNKTIKETESKTERKTVTHKTSTKATHKKTEKQTISTVKSNMCKQENTKKTIIVETTKKTSVVESSTVYTTPEKETESISIEKNEPVLVTDEPNLIKSYNTKVVGPDYVPTNTRRNGHSEESTKTTKFSVFETVMEKVKDEKTFDKLSETMKNKNIMDKILKNTDTDRLKQAMSDVRPQDVLAKMDQKTLSRMGKLMTELDPATIQQMQELVMKTTNFGGGVAGGGNKMVKTR